MYFISPATERACLCACLPRRVVEWLDGLTDMTAHHDVRGSQPGEAGAAEHRLAIPHHRRGSQVTTVTE